MNMKLAGKSTLVTGAGAGIGRAICIRLAEMGASIMAADVNVEKAAETADMLDASAGQSHGSVRMDVTDKVSVEKAVAHTVQVYGGLDILINNAGVSSMNRVEDLTEEEWDFNFNVNIKGVFFVTQAAIPHLKNSRGKIVNTASMASLKAVPLLAHYTATKFAVLGWCWALQKPARWNLPTRASPSTAFARDMCKPPCSSGK